MYEAYYGLKERPFSLVPDPHYLYLSRRHRAALDMLELALRGQAGFSTITGEVGSGKTTLVRRFLELPGDDTTIGIITNTHEDLGDLLQWILLAFGLNQEGKNRIQLYEPFVDFLFEQFSQGQHTVLIIDEAQNLGVSALEQLRVFSNIYDDQEHVLQIILIGQPELLEKLNRPDLKQLAQRISVSFHLGALTINETAAYIQHRLSIAGASRDIFDELACTAVYYFSGGIPRLINILCDFALLYAYAEDLTNVDYKIVWRVVYDKTKTGLDIFENSEQIGDQEKMFNEIFQLREDITVVSTPDATGDEVEPGDMGVALESTEAPPPRNDTEAESFYGSKIQRKRQQDATMTKHVSDSTMGKNKQDNGFQSWEKTEANLGIALEEPVDIKFRGAAEKLSLVAAIGLLVLAGGVAAWLTSNQPQAGLSARGAQGTSASVQTTHSERLKHELPMAPVNVQLQSDSNALDDPTQGENDIKRGAPNRLQAKADSTPTVVSGSPLRARHALEGDKADPVTESESVGKSSDLVNSTPQQSVYPLSIEEAVSLEDAGNVLLSLWGRTRVTNVGNEPCKQAREAGLACLAESGSLERLAKYDRPAIISVRTGNGNINPIVLSRFDGRVATLISPGRTIVAQAAEVKLVFPENYFVFWKPPKIYTRVLREGMSGPDVVWVRRRLAELQEETLVDTETDDLFDPALTQSVKMFQESQDLATDGIVGPRTMIRLAAVGADDAGPRLRPEGAKASGDSKEFSGT